MVIDTKFGEKNCIVVAIYDVEGVIHYLYNPEKSYSGVLAITENECTVVDDCISNFTIHVNNFGKRMNVHKDALDDMLLDDMVDHDEIAMNKFWTRFDARNQNSD